VGPYPTAKFFANKHAPLKSTEIEKLKNMRGGKYE
jgi:hypothetical protein